MCSTLSIQSLVQNLEVVVLTRLLLDLQLLEFAGLCLPISSRCRQMYLQL